MRKGIHKEGRKGKGRSPLNITPKNLQRDRVMKPQVSSAERQRDQSSRAKRREIMATRRRTRSEMEEEHRDKERPQKKGE